MLTARYFAEMYELRMTPLFPTSGCVAVFITLVEPRVEVSLETRWVDGAGFHAVFQRLEFTKQLSTTLYVEPFLHR
jgi:hypothetical protein